jgi:eukaryotic-like serine/threonine-protein kinase
MTVDIERLKRLFLEAIELPDRAARDQFVNEQTSGESGLRGRLLDMVAAHEHPARALDSPFLEAQDAQALGQACPALPGSERSLSPEQAGMLLDGKYKLLELVGEGGMGSVWMAEQMEPVRRKVALKLVKAGMDTRQVLMRFEIERQALALMDHPNIAKVLDGGMTELGRPYFVMEFVRGLPITRYCDDNRLGITERLKLFTTVCQAVQHAHQKGIIHRDIKPGNLLIAMQDGRPVAKVIDFGLAKAMNQPLSDRSLYTLHGMMLGTPSYMSPEQAETNNLDIDTRTDIYSLGVVLYELLTGSTPLDTQAFRQAAWQEMMALIRDTDPPCPSDRLSSSDALPSVAARRHIEPAKLTRMVKGELDWIVMKCLEKDRARRYESADGLADDLERHLADDVVVARPPSAAYRWKKFLRRHRSQAMAGALVMLALAAGLVSTRLALNDAMNQRSDAVAAQRNEAKQRERAEHAESEARTNEQRAREIAESESRARASSERRLEQLNNAYHVLATVFRNLNPGAGEKDGQPLQVVLGDRLAQAARELDANPVEDALTMARIRKTLGDSMLGLGQANSATALLTQALNSLTSELGASHPETLECRFNLAHAYLEDGKRDLALGEHQACHDLRTASLEINHPDILRSQSAIGLCHLRSGMPDVAIKVLREAADLQKSILGPQHHDTLDTLNNLALAYLDQKRHDLALPVFADVLNAQRALCGEEHPETLNALNNFAVCKQAVGKPDELIPVFERLVELSRKHLGANHPDTLARMNNLASTFRETGQLDKSIPMHEEIVARKRDRLGENHPGTLLSIANLGRNYQVAGRNEDARPLLEKAYSYSGQFPELAFVEPHLAECLAVLGRKEEAAELLGSAIGEARNSLAPESPELAARLAQLGWFCVKIELPMLDKAESALRESLAIRERLFPDDWTTFNSRCVLGAALMKQGKLAEAETLLLAGYQGMQTRLTRIQHDVRQSRVVESLTYLVELYTALDKPDEARKWQQLLDAAKN